MGYSPARMTTEDHTAPPPPDSDVMLVQRTLAGERRAYDLLVIKYQRRVERLIGRMVRDSDLVQDIAQETFIRAYRALAQFRGDAQFYTWLYRIAVNTAKKQLMELKRDPLVFQSQLKGAEDDETSAPERELNANIADTETPEAVLASKEIANAVNAAMEALPEELRMAITLREIEGLSYEEIAQALECPIGTVRSRIFRAREAISTRIKPLLDRQSGKRWCVGQSRRGCPDEPVHFPRSGPSGCRPRVGPVRWSPGHARTRRSVRALSRERRTPGPVARLSAHR